MTLRPQQPLAPNQRRELGWIALPLAFSPMILCILLGLLALAVPPHGPTSETCTALQWQGMMLTVARLQQARPAISACSVLAVQLSAIVPVAVFLLAVIGRKLPRSGPSAKVDVNFLVFLFIVLLTYALWMDLLFVGFSYLMMASGRLSRGWWLWFVGTGFVSLISVIFAIWVILLTRQKIQSVVAAVNSRLARSRRHSD